MKRNQLKYRLTSWILALLITFSSASYALADDSEFLDLEDVSYEEGSSDDYYLEDEIMVDPSDPEEDYYEDGEDYPDEDETEAVQLETETPEELFGEFETDGSSSIPDGIQDLFFFFCSTFSAIQYFQTSEWFGTHRPAFLSSTYVLYAFSSICLSF